MPNNFSQIQTQGSLNLEINGRLIKIECEGQDVNMIFTSFKALKDFFYYYRTLNEHLLDFLKKDLFNQIKVNYYLQHQLIGQSKPNSTSNWLASFLGLEHTHFYFSRFLSYFFSTS